MLKKKWISKSLIASVVTLSLIFGQGVVFAADNSEGAKTSIKQIAAYQTHLYCTGTNVRIRAKPNTSSAVLGYLNIDDYIIPSKYSSDPNSDYDWVYGKTSTGITGWVSGQYLEDRN